MLALSSLIETHILNLRIAWLLFISLFKKEKNQSFSFLNLKTFLKSSKSLSYPSVFSPDLSLLTADVYGDDISEFVINVKLVCDKLLLDELLDSENIIKKKNSNFIKNLFIGKKGDFPNVENNLYQLRNQTMRLIDAYELRNKYPELGIYSFKNLALSALILKDLNDFYMELYRDYRNYDPSETPSF